MAPPPLVFRFIGAVFTATLYGKLSNNIRFRWQLKHCTLCHRSLLPDICLILANPTQTSKWTERLSSLRAHSKFHSVYVVFHQQHNRGPVSYHCESYTNHIFCLAVFADGRRLIFEFPGKCAEDKFIGYRFELDDHHIQCTIYRHRLQYTVNIGEILNIQFVLR
jgi:hypothetical protein